MTITRKGLADEFDAQDEIVRAANEHKGDMLKRYRAQLAGQGYDKDAIKAEVEGFKAALKRRRAITKKGSEAVEHLSAIADEIYLEITAPSRTRVTREEFDPETGEVHDEPATEPQHPPAAQDDDAFSAVKAQVRLESAAGVEPSSSTPSQSSDLHDGRLQAVSAPALDESGAGAAGVEAPAASVIPFHPEETREQRTLRMRPHCQRPSGCGASGPGHCHSCTKAMQDTGPEAA